ncbi:respiratory chain complex I subunit 1 family protein [Dehalobacter sp. TBBPA1]|uniref:respiratory chain complex I subunit 1 family protein n=1 Tax=Dehalobacter sp. TBBPA1 TaxID=3235037 RepID=UPI0034A1D610
MKDCTPGRIGNEAMNSITYILIQLIVTLLAAPLVSGLIKKVKALTQKRKGAPVLQMYFDLYKLLQKTSVVSEVSSWIYKVAPYIVFATALTAALLVPVSTKIVPVLIPGDFIMLVSILALGRFFMMAAALDTGSTFGGMGSSREAMISSLIEPSILVTLFTVGLLSGSTSLPRIMQTVQVTGFPLAHPVYMMVGLALLIVIIAETSRIPVDDPSTHLELTMVHEAMILEYSGRHLALLEYGAAVKQLVFITLFVNLFIPHDQLIPFMGFGAVILSLLLYLLKVALMALVIALIEVNTVKFKLFSIPNLAALSFILAFLGILQFFILGGYHV